MRKTFRPRPQKLFMVRLDGVLQRPVKAATIWEALEKLRELHGSDVTINVKSGG